MNIGPVGGGRGRQEPGAKHAQYARIVLAAAERLTVLGVARGPAPARYAEEDVEGLLRDKTCPPGKVPLTATTVAKVLALTCAEPPGEPIHWTGRAIAVGAF